MRFKVKTILRSDFEWHMQLNGWLDACWKGPQLSQIDTKDARGLSQEGSVQKATKHVGWRWECLRAETH